MNNPSEEEILKAINESGYLFEQEVGSIIEKCGFFIQTNSAFKDKDEETSREIDVMGYRAAYKDTDILVAVRILCECKNSQNPFVFIRRNKSESDKYYSPPNFLFPVSEFKAQIKEKNRIETVSAFRYHELDKVFAYSTDPGKSVQFCKITRNGKDWKASHDTIYDSILYPIIKCLEYYKDKDKSFGTNIKEYLIYHPIVVLNSDIYTIDTHISTDKINKVDFVSLTRDIDSKKFKGKYLIDFVKKKKLENYIKNTLNPFVEKFIEKIKYSNSLRGSNIRVI